MGPDRETPFANYLLLAFVTHRLSGRDCLSLSPERNRLTVTPVSISVINALAALRL